MKKNQEINLAAPNKADQAKLAMMPEAQRRTFLEDELLKGLTGQPRKITAEDVKAAVLKKLSQNV